MAVKQYSYSKDGNTQLSKHFKVREFGSFSGSKVYTDKVLINTELVEKLEKLYDFVHASKVVINSGYRCRTHDKAVGGSGVGQHVNGNAADVVFYDQAGKVISTKYICCVASELGFNGIANISARYRATHLDVRSGSRYWGDEIYSFNSIWRRSSSWTDFYKYWKLDRDDVLNMFKQTTTNTSDNKTDTTDTTTEVENVAKIVNGNWNVRSTPVTGKVVTVLNESTIVTYTETKCVNNKTWYYIPTSKGWVCGDGLKTTSVTSNQSTLVVTKGTWNVRKQAGSGAIITTVKKGETYQYTETKTVGYVTWYKIKINNTIGWLSGKAVKKTY